MHLIWTLLLACSALASAPTPDWETIVDQALPGVVVLRVNEPRSFDTEMATSSVATGFVVDAARGIILTNRHVVNPGPVVSEAVFVNHEEVPVRAIYRDPVHDFGFYQFDPDAVRFLKPVALPLAPGAARVGLEVRVIGNDAGDKLSILPGTLSRLDRPAPVYGSNGFNDFNTFYIQAASGTSGGSSGSPVLDAAGRVVALNAGARKQAASSYFLPLDRVVRALAYVQRGEEVPRGTLQAVFSHQTFDEVRRLGLPEAEEAALRARAPGATGLLTVAEVVPGGPADGALEPGDVLVAVEGEPLSAFLPLEAALDDRVGQPVRLTVFRGASRLELSLTVGDLHAITPSSYLEIAGGVVHALSYQQARNHAVPVGTPYVAGDLYAADSGGLSRGTLIRALAGQPTPTLDALLDVIRGLPDAAPVAARISPLADPQVESIALFEPARRWFPARLCQRDATGSWPCVDLPPPPPTPPDSPDTVVLPRTGHGPARRIQPSLVRVSFTVPYQTEGVYGARFVGTGLVVDAARGLVVVDRDTVATNLGDVTLTFGGALQVPGRPLWLHPEHNLVFVQYDPALLGDTPVKSARLAPGARTPVGRKVWQVGLSSGQQLVSRETSIARVDPVSLPLPSPPFFRDINVELLNPEDATPSSGGVLADRRGRALALWASFVDLSGRDRQGSFRGLPIDLVSDALDALKAGGLPVWRSLGVEWSPLTLAEARTQGLSPEAARQVQRTSKTRPQVLSALRITAGTEAAGLIKPGDLLLAIDGQPAATFREVERASAAERVQLTVLRDGQALDLSVPTQVLPGDGVDRALIWAGALLHAPHRPIAAQRGLAPEGVYVAYTWFGSPASRDKLRPTRRILAVEGQPTPDLAAFLAVVQGRPDRGALRLKTVDLDGKVEVSTLRLDLSFWPTQQLSLRDGMWRWEELPEAGG